MERRFHFSEGTMAKKKRKADTAKRDAREKEIEALRNRGLYIVAAHEIDRAALLAGAVNSFLAMMAVALDDSTQLEVTNEQLQDMAEHLQPQAAELKSWIGSLSDT